MSEAQGIASPCAQIRLRSDASELAPSSNRASGPALGLLGLGCSPGRLVAIARARARSAPLMGIPNLLPFPVHPHFRLPFMRTHSLLQRRPKSPPPSPSFCPQTPPIQSTKAAPKNPLTPTKSPGRYCHQGRFYASAFTSQIPSLQLGERFAGCRRSFIMCTFTSRQRPAPKHTEQRKPFSAIIDEKTFTPRTESLKCFESTVSENNRSNIWHWGGGPDTLPGAISQKCVPQGFTLALRKEHKKTR